MTSAASFDRYGPVPPESPVLLSAPHGGRDYPESLLAALRVSPAVLRALEDRHVDSLALGARRDETLFVATRARAWIDLNRAEHERDPQIDEGAHLLGRPLSAKVRSGLGLVPRRVGTLGQLWRGRFAAEDVTARIHADHRPYHLALAEALAAARARFGIALLLDIHSMPPLGSPESAPRLVIGDRFGRAAAARFGARVEAVARQHGIAVAANTPYAGGHILERHGDPRRGVHALQLEIDRSLYLDAQLDQLGPGAETVAALLRAIIDALADETLPGALAAE
ncbi:N-formylglutamate amidohydrolase [Sphingomonas sp. ABOLD]|uniref:N-formylglutamate amidohydrolase n=1 Tax=Sphingomonas trueperi TaxID=53317 RepID=A0A7X5Y0B8_9SPHN|nr:MULTISPECIES: N-formylglutamate amidohydrolase [unclassified Sphingomonas]NJB98707.1 N-formylglutamate amidohydrolase [Sphingomonas trueperi]RSV43926.1 N-formylglutamate amidohydrolase [Sphingomonas sp. ABOLE]RSV45872.1 N-formylglutamate amidohydrolase [Sphingomonas sp. ABOLD]